jgi:alcohol dehydrogenase class IV
VFESPGSRAPSVVEGLGRSVVEVITTSMAGVPADVVRQGVRSVRDGSIDTIVSIGGGAVVDAAKAVAFFTEREAGTPGTSFTDRPVLNHVAVPTTFAPSATSASFAMTDPTSRNRQATSSPTLVPRWVIVDTDLIGATPLATLRPSLVAAVDAALAAALWARSPEAELIGAATLARLVAVADLLDDADVRATAAATAVLAGRAAANAAPSLPHALAVLFSGRRRIDHGAVLAVLLPALLGLRLGDLGARLEQVAHGVGTADLIGRLAELRDDLGLPAHLGALGIDRDDVDAVARAVRSTEAWAALDDAIDETALLDTLESVR